MALQLAVVAAGNVFDDKNFTDLDGIALALFEKSLDLGSIKGLAADDPDPYFVHARNARHAAGAGILDARKAAHALVEQRRRYFHTAHIDDVIGAPGDAQDAIFGQTAEVARIPPRVSGSRGVVGLMSGKDFGNKARSPAHQSLLACWHRIAGNVNNLNLHVRPHKSDGVRNVRDHVVTCCGSEAGFGRAVDVDDVAAKQRLNSANQLVRCIAAADPNFLQRLATIFVACLQQGENVLDLLHRSDDNVDAERVDAA